MLRSPLPSRHYKDNDICSSLYSLFGLFHNFVIRSDLPFRFTYHYLSSPHFVLYL